MRRAHGFMQSVDGAHCAPYRMRHSHGFTLLELLVTVSILATLAAVAWGAYDGVQEKAQDELARAEMLRLADALRRFRQDTGFYPGQGPFALADAACNGGGVSRSWAPVSVQDAAIADYWFASPANIALLIEPPVLCANHPLAFLASWNPETRRGWHGPYLDRSARAWLDLPASLNEASVTVAGDSTLTCVTDGSCKLKDVPAFGAGPKFSPTTSVGNACHEANAATCLYGWRSVPRTQTGYVADTHELVTHARPFLMLGLPNNDFPRIAYWGPDGRYGGRNLLDLCAANTAVSEGQDDVVLCLN